MTQFRALLLCSTLIIGGRCAAAVDLYYAEVAVQDQGTAERVIATRNALVEVLIKLSGDTHVSTRPEIAASLQRAGRLVQRYQYRVEQVAEATDDPLVMPQMVDQSYLQVWFNRPPVFALLKQAAVPIWPEDRGEVLVWLLVDEGGSRRIVADGDGDEQASIYGSANRRGLPVLLPLMDVVDRQQVRTSELWGGFFDHAVAASGRYEVSTVLLGRVNRRGSQWVGRWVLAISGHEESWREEYPELTMLMQSAIDGVADRLAAHYAVRLDREAKVLIEVAGVVDIAHYDRVLDYLGGLSFISGVEVEMAVSDRLGLTLLTGMSGGKLREAIAAGDTLRVGTPTVDGGRRYEQYFELLD